MLLGNQKAIIKIKGGIKIIHTSSSTRGAWIITNNLLPMVEFKDVIFPHGLLAYSGYAYEVMERLKALEDKSLHICCGLPEQYIGQIGVYVKGDVKVVSESDLHSDILIKNNFRVFNPKYLIEIFNKEGLSNVDLSVTGEAILSNIDIVGVWYKQNCEKDILEEVTTYLGVEGIMVPDYKPFLLTS